MPNPNPNKFHERLLSACRQSYLPDNWQTSAGQSWQAAEPGIGFTAQPGVVAHEFLKDAPRDLAVVGRIAEGILVSFRGTVPPFSQAGHIEVLDWLNDFKVLAYDGPEFPGSVHSGFAKSTLGLWHGTNGQPGVRHLIEQLRPPGDSSRIFLTGHSKGGPLANMTAALITGVGNQPALDDVAGRVEVVTFASAMPGNKEFRDSLVAAIASCTRYEIGRDPVPHLPPGEGSLQKNTINKIGKAFMPINYVPVGTRILHGKTGLVGAALDLATPDITAHSIAIGSQYDRLVKGEL